MFFKLFFYFCGFALRLKLCFTFVSLSYFKALLFIFMPLLQKDERGYTEIFCDFLFWVFINPFKSALEKQQIPSSLITP